MTVLALDGGEISKVEAAFHLGSLALAKRLYVESPFTSPDGALVDSTQHELETLAAAVGVYLDNGKELGVSLL
jgi:hypothetical protein